MLFRSNVLAGGLGKDTLEGGYGDDTYVLSDNLDVIIDSGGIDTLRSVLDVSLFAGIENAELVGISDVSAVGNAYDNVLIGNLGNNVLDGGLGADTLTGGQGGDQFVLAYNGVGVAADSVTDFFSGEDLLIVDLNSFGVDPAVLGILSSGLVSDTSFIAGAGAVAVDANDHFIFDTAQGLLKFDSDGNGSAAAVDVAHISYDDESVVLRASDVFVGI